MRFVFCILLSFVVGCVVMYFLSSALQIPGGGPNRADLCRREVDIALGRATIDGVPILDKTLRLMDSNRLDEAKCALRNYIWWQLEDAWAKNQMYQGAMNPDLDSLLIDVYPGLRQNIQFESFTNFPAVYLTEMTNFVRAADATVASKDKR